jgi:hypothetical protein
MHHEPKSTSNADSIPDFRNWSHRLFRRLSGQADGKISRPRIQAGVHLLLRDRPALLEMIIEDCSRWEDWSIAPRLMEIHAGGK